MGVFAVETSGARYHETSRFHLRPYQMYDDDGNHVHGQKYNHRGYNYGFGSSYGPAGSSSTKRMVKKTISGYRESSHSGREPSGYGYHRPSYGYRPSTDYDPYRGRSS